MALQKTRYNCFITMHYRQKSTIQTITGNDCNSGNNIQLMATINNPLVKQLVHSGGNFLSRESILCSI